LGTLIRIMEERVRRSACLMWRLMSRTSGHRSTASTADMNGLHGLMRWKVVVVVRLVGGRDADSMGEPTKEPC
jgi:hypothetical protein